MAAASKGKIWLPYPRSLILCHDAMGDRGTNNVDLRGVFDSIRPGSYPHRFQEFCVYCQLTDYQGEVPAYVQIVAAASGDVAFQSRDHTVRFPDRNKVVRTLFRIKQCLFETPGVYLIELYCRNQLLADHPLRLLS